MKRAFTLIELLVGMLVLVTGGGLLLMGMFYATVHASYLREAQVAANVAEGRLQQLASTDFATLRNLPALRRCLFEDLNCNTLLEVGEDVNGNVMLDSLPLTNGWVALEIQPVNGTTQTATLFELRAAVCWTFRGRRIGEGTPSTPCSNTGGNSWVESPVALVTRVAQPS